MSRAWEIRFRSGMWKSPRSASSITPLDLVRSIDPADWRREESASLVLRLKLKNISKDHAFAPLERRFLREQTSASDRSTIVTSRGQRINLFPLADRQRMVDRGSGIHSAQAR